MLVRATTNMLLSFWDAKFIKLHLPDGCLMGKLPLISEKVWSLKVSDSKPFEDLTTFSLLSWGICEVQRNIPSFLWQNIRELCSSECKWYHSCALANLFLSLMSSCSYDTNSSDCIVETKHGVSRKGRTFRQNQQTNGVWVVSMYILCMRMVLPSEIQSLVNPLPSWLLMPILSCPRARSTSKVALSKNLETKQKESTRLDDWTRFSWLWKILNLQYKRWAINIHHITSWYVLQAGEDSPKMVALFWVTCAELSSEIPKTADACKCLFWRLPFWSAS